LEAGAVFKNPKMIDLKQIEQVSRGLTELRGAKEPPSWEAIQAVNEELRATLSPLAVDVRRLYESAVLVISEFDSLPLAVEAWKDLREKFSTLLAALERLPVLDPESSSLYKHTIGVVRSIVDEAYREYQSYSETAHLLSSKANASRLLTAVEEADGGNLPVYESAEEMLKGLRGK
jgi:hypothetical protein